MRRSVRSLAVAVLLGSCAATPASEQRASLCTDLQHLEATIGSVLAPEDGASIGEVRGDLEKLEPTFSAIASTDVVPSETAQELLDAREAYLDVLRGTGDDDIFGPGRAAAERRRLDRDLTAARGALACTTAAPS